MKVKEPLKNTRHRYVQTRNQVLDRVADWESRDKRYILFTFLAVYLTAWFVCLDLLLNHPVWKETILFITACILWYLTERFAIKQKDRRILVLTWNVMIFINIASTHVVSNIIGYSFWFFPLMYVAYRKKDRFYQVLAAVVLFLNFYNVTNHFFILVTVLGLGAVVLYYYAMNQGYYHYSLWLKLPLYLNAIMTLLFLSTTVTQLLELPGRIAPVIWFFSISLINAWCIRSWFCNSWNFRGKREFLCYYFCRWVNALLILYALIIMPMKWVSTPLHWMILAVTTFLAYIDISETLGGNRDSRYFGLYIGLKYTTFVHGVLLSFGLSISYSTSAFYIVVGLLTLIGGGVKRIWSFRFYGRVLLIIGIVKMILIDIPYYQVWTRLVGVCCCAVIVGGVLTIYQLCCGEMDLPENQQIKKISLSKLLRGISKKRKS